jgi:hypothetical protein
MNARALLVVVAALAALRAEPARAGPDPAAKAAAAAAALKKQEDVGRAKAAEELGRLAGFCALKNDFEGARRDYARALAFNGADAKLKTELEKTKGRKGKPLKADLDAIADRRTKALAKCAELLTPAASAYAQADRSDELAALVQLLVVQGVPVKDLAAKLQMVVFEPYLDWRTKKAVAKLEEGWEYLDGAWADPKKVAELDAAHATWSSPWVFADEVHEVRSNLPRRMAKQVAAHVFAFRAFFLGYFAGEWELIPPTVKLPVLVTRTREELEARVRENSSMTAPQQAAAFYLHSSGVGNPCFASVESRAAGGSTRVVGFELLQHTFEHELGHQIAFEYSKAAASKMDTSADFLWVVEGLADFLPNYDLVDGAWKLVHPPWIGEGDVKAEAAFAWCKEHADEIPPLAEFVALSRSEFRTVRNYHVAAALAGYLLEARDREYRQAFIDLAEAVHRGKADSSSVAACFPGETLKTIDADFRAWCKKQEIAPGNE